MLLALGADTLCAYTGLWSLASYPPVKFAAQCRFLHIVTEQNISSLFQTSSLQKYCHKVDTVIQRYLHSRNELSQVRCLVCTSKFDELGAMPSQEMQLSDEKGVPL